MGWRVEFFSRLEKWEELLKRLVFLPVSYSLAYHIYCACVCIFNSQSTALLKKGNVMFKICVSSKIITVCDYEARMDAMSKATGTVKTI